MATPVRLYISSRYTVCCLWDWGEVIEGRSGSLVGACSGGSGYFSSVFPLNQRNVCYPLFGYCKSGKKIETFFNL
ncbi:hypothetical protein Hanom_Chr04g00335771 [Helianthus anomalus]